METESDKRLDQLFANARADSTEASAREEHFETRLLARIRERRSQQQPWYALAWRMLPTYAVVVAIVAICSVTFTPAHSTDIFAALTGAQDDSVSISALAGE